ncbi:DUF2946 family protein [Sphingomonas sp. TX0543]|uniref:DUF2946 family protein n=1 Tax=unclassified Sphingomonas TaxID=196159 RepID=UPI0020166191|nr:DUF2946 family protein [Sphingomonas sp. 3P27F8]
MHRLRRLVFANRPFACAIIALALLLKIAIPAGFMPTVSNGQIVVSICSGMGPATMVMTVPGLEHKSDNDGHPGKAEQPCAFAGLSALSLPAADPILLAAAILFVLALGTRPLTLSASSIVSYLRPPLRGPPAL